MKYLSKILTGIAWIAIGFVFLIFAVPFFLIVFPFLLIRERIENRKFKEYLTRLEGKNFFCYNNKKRSLGFICEEILPNLPQEIESIYLNGRVIESHKYNPEFLSRAFYQFKDYRKFPHLLKIRNGEAVDISINAEFFQVLDQKKDVSIVMNKMNHFFELNAKNDH